MKEFNWEGFRSGKFAVHCDTEEKAREFIKEAYSRGIKWMTSDVKKTYWDVTGENTCYYGSSGLLYGHVDNCDIKIIEWRSDDMKNFREVIRDIKEGEVWENENFLIELNENEIEIRRKKGFDCDTIGIIFNDNKSFSLKQQPVTFEEVLNSDKRCRVEHELLKHELYKEYCDFDKLLNKFYCGWDSKEIKEIIKNGKWYLEP